jgi:hypothetical protein
MQPGALHGGGLPCSTAEGEVAAQGEEEAPAWTKMGWVDPAVGLCTLKSS